MSAPTTRDRAAELARAAWAGDYTESRLLEALRAFEAAVREDAARDMRAELDRLNQRLGCDQFGVGAGWAINRMREALPVTERSTEGTSDAE